jgi:hypothetical protein
LDEDRRGTMSSFTSLLFTVVTSGNSLHKIL